jgi:indole-3-glycerol phosphate synthase
MSVLTDREFFGGNNSDLSEVAGFLEIPVLRKDFIIDEYQVLEAKAIGASAILLIASLLTKEEIDSLSLTALNLGMDTLYEIHDRSDLDKISRSIKIIGVNNRNLKTFGVSMRHSEELFRYLPEDSLKVAESGFNTAEDVAALFRKGFDAFLIGENFMKTENPGISASAFIRSLKSVII